MSNDSAESIRRRMLITYAVVSHEMVGSNDILSGLLPFFEPILVPKNGQIFDNTEFIREVAANTHWNLTVDVASQIVDRMARAKWLTRETAVQDDVIYRVTLPTSLPSEGNAEKLMQLDRLVTQFSSFLATLPDPPPPISSFEETKELLLQWMVDSFSLPASARVPNGTSLTETTEIPNVDSRISPTEQYLFARFVVWVTNNDSELSKLLAEIGGAVMLTEVILHFRNPSSANRRQLRLSVFVDAPMIMDYLGLSGRTFRDSAAYTIDKFRNMGCTIACFSHSRDEIRDILMALTHSDHVSRFGPTADALRRKEITESQVAVTLASLDQQLKKARIEIVATTLGQLRSTRTFFPDELVEKLTNELGQSNYSARERDAKSAAMVMRKRQGHRTSDLFDARVIMVSQNRRLCSAAKRVTIDDDLLGQWDIGPVIHRSDAAGALFLVMGSDEREKVSRAELLGICMNITRLRPRIVEEVKSQLIGLQSSLSEEDLDALLTDPRCAVALMDATVGADRVVDRSNVEKIVEVVKLSLLNEEQRRFEIELKDSEARAAKRYDEQEEHWRSELKRAERLARNSQDTANKLSNDLESAQQSRERALRNLVAVHASRIDRNRVGVRVVLAGAMILLAVFVAFLAGTLWDVYVESGVGVATLFIEAIGIFGFHLPAAIDSRIYQRQERAFDQAISLSALEDVRKYYDIDLKRRTATPINTSCGSS